jgi:hypothetical protein
MDAGKAVRQTGRSRGPDEDGADDSDAEPSGFHAFRGENQSACCSNLANSIKFQGTLTRKIFIIFEHLEDFVVLIFCCLFPMTYNRAAFPRTSFDGGQFG